MRVLMIRLQGPLLRLGTVGPIVALVAAHLAGELREARARAQRRALHGHTRRRCWVLAGRELLAHRVLDAHLLGPKRPSPLIATENVARPHQLLGGACKRLDDSKGSRLMPR